MLKVRIIGVLVVKEGLVVQSIGFQKYLPVGLPEIAVEYLNRWGIDEIVVLDISATAKGQKPDPKAIAGYSKYCHVPLSVGGGIKTAEDMHEVIHAGADKIVINSAAAKDLRVITEGARLYGNQCMIVSIDARRVEENKYGVFTLSGSIREKYTPAEFAKMSEDAGAGEIFINSIDRDGLKKGFDMKLIKSVIEAVNIPVIACGGVNSPEHFIEAIDAGVSAVASANFFHYTEHSVITAKQYLRSKGKNVRLDSYSTYSGSEFDEHGRIAKTDDKVLEKLRFQYIPEEVI